MDADNLHRRLKKIIGQVQAIDRMVDEDVPCEDILSQLNAAKSALHKVGQVVLEGHIKHCVRDGIEHGDADKTVPFEQAAMENLGGLWGSSAVAKSLENLQASYYFYKVENAGHEISGLPMSRNQYDIMSFLSRQVLGDENLAITTDERVPGDTIVRKDFTVQDYILDNLR